jgi:hypothetical protein
MGLDCSGGMILRLGKEWIENAERKWSTANHAIFMHQSCNVQTQPTTNQNIRYRPPAYQIPDDSSREKKN